MLRTERKIGKLRIGLVYSAFLLGFSLSNFYRISATVVLLYLPAHWRLNAFLQGLISSLFFYAYAGMQPFCGILNDRKNPLLVASVGLGLSGLGTVLMSYVESATVFCLGRVLAGVGFAPLLSGTLVFQKQFLPEHRYALFSGITYATGNLGGVISVRPLQACIERYSLKSVHCFMALLCFILALLLLLQLKKFRITTAVCRSWWRELAVPFQFVLRSRQLKTMLALWMAICGIQVTFQGLWSVSWYEAAYGLSAAQASAWATMAGIGVMAGNLGGGLMDRLLPERRHIITIAVLGHSSFWCLLWFAMTGTWPLPFSGMLCLLTGFCAGVLYTQFTAGVKAMAQDEKGGAVFGVMNFGVFLSVIVFQLGSGGLVNLASGGGQEVTAGAISSAFAVLLFVLFLIQGGLWRSRSFLPLK
jgi:MFS family permease